MPVPSVHGLAAVSSAVSSEFGGCFAKSLGVFGDLPDDLLDASDEDVEPDADFVDFVVAFDLDAPGQVAFAFGDILQAKCQRTQWQHNLGLNHPPGDGADKHDEAEHDKSGDSAAHRPGVHRVELLSGSWRRWPC